jgi:ribosome-associated toxin RatA of RatAB toxin-antitoxin module
MPRDEATATLVVDAEPERVLEVLRDVERQPEWVPGVTSAELLEEYEDGGPATARIGLTTPIGADQFTLEFEPPDGPSVVWSLVEGKVQTAQDGAYTVRDLGDGRSEVTLSLAVEHNVAVPGFLRRKAFSGWVEGSLRGLQRYLGG